MKQTITQFLVEARGLNEAEATALMKDWRLEKSQWAYNNRLEIRDNGGWPTIWVSLQGDYPEEVVQEEAKLIQSEIDRLVRFKRLYSILKEGGSL
jgi:hypothetical protein